MAVMLVTDRRTFSAPLEETVASALRGGVAWIQLREKDLSAAELLELARRLLALTRDAGAHLVLNAPPDLVRDAGADGIHLRADGPAVEVVRITVGQDCLVGRSTHTLEEAVAAAAEGADYVIFGPVFATPSKMGILQPRGIPLLERVTRTIQVPVLAIGGIDASNARQVMDAGAHGVAVIRAIGGAADPRSAASSLVAATGGVGPSRSLRADSRSQNS